LVVLLPAAPAGFDPPGFDVPCAPPAPGGGFCVQPGGNPAEQPKTEPVPPAVRLFAGCGVTQPVPGTPSELRGSCPGGQPPEPAAGPLGLPELGRKLKLGGFVVVVVPPAGCVPGKGGPPPGAPLADQVPEVPSPMFWTVIWPPAEPAVLSVPVRVSE